MAELRARAIVRSGNNPIADIAERLVADYYGGTVAPPNEKGFDVLTKAGERLQVKALRRTQKGRTTLSPLRSHEFDAVVIVVFELDMRVVEALHVPLSVVEARQGWSSTWQAHRLSLTASLRGDGAVSRIGGAELLRGAEARAAALCAEMTPPSHRSPTSSLAASCGFPRSAAAGG
jgi:hypothetical protein